jgi:hypothetical protein
MLLARTKIPISICAAPRLLKCLFWKAHIIRAIKRFVPLFAKFAVSQKIFAIKKRMARERCSSQESTSANQNTPFSFATGMTHSGSTKKKIAHWMSGARVQIAQHRASLQPASTNLRSDKGSLCITNTRNEICYSNSGPNLWTASPNFFDVQPISIDDGIKLPLLSKIPTIFVVLHFEWSIFHAVFTLPMVRPDKR